MPPEDSNTRNRRVTDIQNSVSSSERGEESGSDTSSSYEIEDDVEENENENYEQKLGAAALQNSRMPTAIFMDGATDVHVGPRVNYNAPVTIKQYVNVSETVTEEELFAKAVEPPLSEVKEANDVKITRITPTTDIRFQKKLPQKPASFWERNRWYLVCGTAVITITALIIITVAIVYTSGKNGSHSTSSINPHSSNEPLDDPPPDDPPNPNNTLPNGKRIFTKEEWGGRRPRFVRNLPHPTPYVVISHTATEMCYVSNLCAAQLRSIQDYHVGEFDQPDIGHNFLVGADGNVYEGRGWDATNFHTGFVKRINLGVGLFGNFLYDEPTAIQIESTQQLLDLGVKLEKLDPNYYLFSHNYTAPIESPGRNLYRIISTWEHFRIPNSTLMNS